MPGNDPHPSIALFGFGEVGSMLVEHVKKAVRATSRLEVLDPFVNTPSGEAVRARARVLGITVHTEAGPWLRDADLVISAVPGSEARAAADAATFFLRPGALYIDMTTAAPEAVRSIAENLERAGVDYVDAALMGAVSARGSRTPMILAGPSAGRAHKLLASIGLDARPVSPVAGDAVAIKSLRSVFMKGLEALSIECFVAAHERGLVDETVDALADLDERPIARIIATLVETHTRHAKRRLDEVAMVRDGLHHDGLPHDLMDATEAVFRRTVLARNEGKVPDLTNAPDFAEAIAHLARVATGGAEDESHTPGGGSL